MINYSNANKTRMEKQQPNVGAIEFKPTAKLLSLSQYGSAGYCFLAYSCMKFMQESNMMNVVRQWGSLYIYKQFG